MNKKQELKERIYKHCPELDKGIKHLKSWDNKCTPVHCFSPIHLEHLLIAIQKSYFNCVYYPAMTRGVMKLNIQIPEREANYDLTKSFDQNCENPELVDFLLEVIK